MSLTDSKPGSVTLVTTSEELEGLAGRLESAPRLGLDTESASFHRYHDRVCLVQISTGDETWLVDTLAIGNLEPMRRVLEDPATELVFHDADYDLRTLDRDYGFRPTRLFDTKVAARLLGVESFGLAALVERFLGVRLEKKHQRADWSRRPLSPAMVEYAAADTRYLLALRDRLEAELLRLHRRQWAEEEFLALERTRWTATKAPDAFRRIRGAGALDSRELAVLQAVYEWREEVARRIDRAPFRVLNNEALLAIARRATSHRDALERTVRLPPALRAELPRLLERIAERLAARDPRLPAGRSRPPGRRRDPLYARRMERLKALRHRRATALGLEPSVLCSNAVLQLLAREGEPALKADAAGGLRRWQREVLGEADLRAALGPSSEA